MMSVDESPYVTLHTIGHGNRTTSDFIHLLKENGITVVVDVRSSPFSRYNPQFNKETLEFSLKEDGIQYLYKGKHLGGRPTDPTCYKNRTLPEADSDYLHEVDYREVMKKDWFQRGITQLLDLARENSVSILCSEEDPANCHRHHLIAVYLLENFSDEVRIYHIRDTGVVFNASQIRKSVNRADVEQKKLF